MRTKHNISPIYDEQSKVLILGSFPSVKSRQSGFYYQHPQNRFWKILEALFDVQLSTIEAKRDFLLTYHIALWDVIESCEINGSSDASIQNIRINSIQTLVKNSSIEYIITNGKKAHELYQRYCFHDTGIDDTPLPSSSPANAAYSLDKLILEYQIIYNCLSIHI